MDECLRRLFSYHVRFRATYADERSLQRRRPLELVAQRVVLRPVLPLQPRLALRLLHEPRRRVRQLELSLPQGLRYVLSSTS